MGLQICFCSKTETGSPQLLFPSYHIGWVRVSKDPVSGAERVTHISDGKSETSEVKPQKLVFLRFLRTS